MDETQAVRCVECAHCNLRSSKTWAAMGLCVCAIGPSWTYLPVDRLRECAKHRAARPDAVAKRREWLLAQKR